MYIILEWWLLSHITKNNSGMCAYINPKIAHCSSFPVLNNFQRYQHQLLTNIGMSNPVQFLIIPLLSPGSSSPLSPLNLHYSMSIKSISGNILGYFHLFFPPSKSWLPKETFSPLSFIPLKN